MTGTFEATETRNLSSAAVIVLSQMLVRNAVKSHFRSLNILGAHNFVKRKISKIPMNLDGTYP